MAKLELVFESDDPAEAGYRDLIREIDTEAQTGIFLVHKDTTARHLLRLYDEPGISGDLHDCIETVAPTLFPDEVRHSDQDLDLVRVTIEASHDRAHVDSTVSEIIMSHILDDRNAARDMTNAMRSLHYAFHENVVRRRCQLPRLLDDRDERDLLIMVTELVKRGGSYDDRAAEIRGRADDQD